MGQNLGCAPLRNGLLGYLTTIINLEIILKQLPGAVSLKTPGKQKYLSLASIRAVLFLTILTTDADDTEKAHCVSWGKVTDSGIPDKLSDLRDHCYHEQMLERQKIVYFTKLFFNSTLKTNSFEHAKTHKNIIHVAIQEAITGYFFKCCRAIFKNI